WAWLPEAAGQAAAALIVLVVWGLLYRSLDGLATRDRLLVFLALLLLALLGNDLHVTIVDQGRYFGTQDNAAWQQGLYADILSRNPRVLPHSYRFLPFSFVRVLECLTRSVPDAAQAYRMI